MKRETQIQAMKFTLLSLSAGLVEVGSFALFSLMPMSYSLRHLLSITLSVLWNFTLNRRYTFKSAGNIPQAMLKVALFYAFFIPLSTWLGQSAVDVGWNQALVKAITLLANFAGEFIWWKGVVFRGTENTRKLS